MTKTLAVLSVAMSLLSPTTYADDAEARGLYETAAKLYDLRAEDDNNDKAIEALDSAYDTVEDAALKIDIALLATRAYYWRGMHLDKKKAKMEAYEAAYEYADEIKDQCGDDQNLCGAGHYYYALNLARWAEVKGVIESLSRKQELLDNLAVALKNDATIDSYGPNRILGRMYFKLPGFAGGDNKKSLEHLKLAMDSANPPHVLNSVFYAETLIAVKKKDDACDVLDEVIKKATDEGDAYNPARIPETKEELAEAKALNEKRCK